MLKIVQAGSAAKMSIVVTNKSGALISTWQIGVSVFDESKRFRASGTTDGSHLGPGESTSSIVYFDDVEAATISSWHLRLNGVDLENESGEMLFDSEKYFQLTEVK